MDKCRKNVIKNSIIKIIAISLVGTLLHFAYEFSGGNLFVAIFSAVNESVWEHIKIGVFAIYFVAFFEMAIVEKRERNLWISLLYKVLTLCVIIPFLYYTYKAIFGVEKMVLDIIIFFIAIIISQIIENIVRCKADVSAKVEDVYKYLNILVIILFAIFTFYPPKLGIFKDNSK